MPKRKRSEPSPTPSDDSGPTDRKLSRQKKLCSQRIAAAQKPIVAALRLGAGFERQKHSRRKKTAQQKNDTKAVERLDAEYAVLKGLDIPKLAEQHLRKTIAKVKSLREHEAIPQSAKEIEKGAGEKDPATLNVTARLWKVAAVKNSVDEVINDLKIIVGAGDAATKTTSGKAKETSSKKKKAKIQEEEDESAEEFSDGDDDIYAAYSARIAAPSSGDEDSDASISEDDRPPSIIDSEGEHDPDADLEAASEPSESDSFHHFSSEGDDEENGSGIIEDSDIAEDSESESDSESIPIPKAKDKAPKTAKPSTSTFLPSLSHAAYFSGSESEASDLDNTDFAPRKNRRGQRARQKIAEQKYGEKAKHLQKEERNKGWDAKRGAVSDDRGRKGGKGGSGKGGKGGAPRGMKTGYGPERSGENAVPLGQRKTKRDDVGQLHPSWQAAKAAKEKKLDMKPQGKKVVFD